MAADETVDETTATGRDVGGGRGEHRRRVVVVLGGGSTLGRSFHAGVLLALRDLTGIDARDVDTIIGTSSGAIVAALLGAGIGPEDLFRQETGLPLGEDAVASIDRARLAQSGAARPDAIQVPVPAAPLVGLRAVGRRQAIAPGAIMAGLLPRGSRSLVPLRDYVDAILGHEWPSRPRLALCAVDLASGQRVLFDSTSDVAVGWAVAASCSLPAIHRPIRVQGHDYVDGAVHSLNNADAAADLEPDLVVVSAPLSTGRYLAIGGVLAEYRNLVHAQAGREIARLRQVAPVVVVEPPPALSRAMGPDLSANDRRHRVARLAYDLSRGVLEEQLARHAPGDARQWS